MDKKKMGTIGLVLAILTFIPLVAPLSSLSVALVITIIGIVVAIASIICAIIAFKESKGKAIATIIIAIISTILLFFAILGFTGIKNATDCVDNGNGISTFR